MSVSHSPDVGGRLLSADSREVFEEGFRLPIMKLFKAASRTRNSPHHSLNVRVPDIVVGDLMAQLASNTIMARRSWSSSSPRVWMMPTLCSAPYGKRSDLAMRQAIAKIPPGTYCGEVETDGFDHPITLRCAITVKSDEIHVDCEGSSVQQEHASTARSAGRSPEVAHACICVAHPPSPSTARH
jgi:N-methylhydantoinase B